MTVMLITLCVLGVVAIAAALVVDAVDGWLMRKTAGRCAVNRKHRRLMRELERQP